MKKIEISAGFVIIKNNKILLGHPTNASWKGRHSFPKGHVEDNESIIDAAIRETKEEVGLIFTRDSVSGEVYTIEYLDKNNKLYKIVYYYVIYCDDLPDVLSKEQLQKEEIDYAAFYDKKVAEEIIFWRFKPILSLLED